LNKQWQLASEFGECEYSPKIRQIFVTRSGEFGEFEQIFVTRSGEFGEY
jgi:hypothetical protein